MGIVLAIGRSSHSGEHSAVFIVFKSIYTSFAMIHSVITRLYVCDHRKRAFLEFPRSLTSIQIVSELYVSAEEVWNSATHDSPPFT